ncbi:MAG: glycerol-3-phosphate 1-O-acyltransferase PlsY [Thermodesulfovibrionales bacterium]
MTWEIEFVIKIAFLIIFAFLLGSIPIGVILARMKGVDLKKVGSGNIGATNVLRSIGRYPAILTLIGDMLKGTLAAVTGWYFDVGILYEGIIGLFAILGHNFSFFLGFKGGKGVATSIGVLLFYSPYPALITCIIWLVVVIRTKYSSLGALISFGLLPLLIYIIDFSKEKLFVAFLITVFIVIRHKNNIQRLMKGTERKIGQRT